MPVLEELNAVGAWLIDMERQGRGAQILIPAYVALTSLDALTSLASRRRWTSGEALPNLASALIGQAVNALVGVLIAAAYLYVYGHFRLFTLPMTFAGFFGAFLLLELYHYAHHRLSHRTGLLWAVHSVHHSSNEMNTTVAARILWGIALTEPHLMVLPLLGVSPIQFGVITLLTTIYGVWNHSRVVPKLGFLEHVLVTPSNHRVHHGRQPKYLDCNFGQTIILFDKLFGTHRLEGEEPDYGLVEREEVRNPFLFQIAGFRRLARSIRSADRLGDKLKYLIMPPGWRHTGDHLTTEALRRGAAVGEPLDNVVGRAHG
jgi:sterol desaturase/sphingolipid hydroxylase (fatty acid hydroxylase superfamily)